MSAPVIRVENLGKHFIIGHEKAERYTALRDVIANNVRGVVRKTGNMMRGKISNDEHTTEEFWALKDISFEIQQGDRLGIIGRNGAGKSTLLKVLSRITEPSKGRISIRGRVASLLEVGTGFHPELSGRENIFLNGAILGMARSEIKKKFDEIVDFAEVEKFLDTPVKRYSSGMYVRLAFAVAAHLEPEILIVDEVLAVGDAQFQKKCLGKMEDVSKNGGRTVLFVSHNMGVITQLCNKAILINKGSVEKNGTVQEVVDTYILSDGAKTGAGYVAEEIKTRHKKNYFDRIWLANQHDAPTTEFLYDQPIRIMFDFIINEHVADLKIGIGMQDKYQNRVTTFLKPVDYFSRSGDVYKGCVELPANTFAPNSYSFTFALWTKGIEPYDNIDNVCHFKIHDNGSDMVEYEGVDYGSVIINPKWS